MPRTRLEVAREVHDVFKQAEEAVELSAAAVARCLAVLIEARIRAKVAPGLGSDAMAVLATASTHALEARRQVLAAHPMLDAVARDLGVVGYGPDKEPVPNEPFFQGASTPFRVVAEAA